MKGKFTGSYHLLHVVTSQQQKVKKLLSNFVFIFVARCAIYCLRICGANFFSDYEYSQIGTIPLDSIPYSRVYLGVLGGGGAFAPP